MNDIPPHQFLLVTGTVGRDHEEPLEVTPVGEAAGLLSDSSPPAGEGGGGARPHPLVWIEQPLALLS